MKYEVYFKSAYKVSYGNYLEIVIIYSSDQLINTLEDWDCESDDN